MGLIEEMSAFSTWHQKWEIEPGVFTPGSNDIRAMCDALQLPPDLTGLRVIDIGAWNGCLAFECERRGAAEVVASDLHDPDVNAFNFIKRRIGSRVTYRQDSVYCLDPAELGQFDVICFCGVLYHLRYPLLAMDRIRAICSPASRVYIETHVVTGPRLLLNKESDDAQILSGDEIAARLDATQTPIWRFYHPFEVEDRDPSNWFGPNIAAVIDGFNSAGFTTRLTRQYGDRATFLAEVSETQADRIYRTQEGLSPINRQFIGLQRKRGKNPLFG